MGGGTIMQGDIDKIDRKRLWFFFCLFQSILPECTASHRRSHGLRALKFHSLGLDYKSS